MIVTFCNYWLYFISNAQWVRPVHPIGKKCQFLVDAGEPELFQYG
jgi:hypothetical protein